MTDTARIRTWLEAGRDVCPTDWNDFNTPDGGKPILRVAARIKDLRNDGFPVERVGTSNRCAVYRKAGVSSVSSDEPVSHGEVSKSAEEAPETLFEVPSAFNPYEEVA